MLTEGKNQKYLNFASISYNDLRGTDRQPGHGTWADKPVS